MSDTRPQLKVKPTTEHRLHEYGRDDETPAETLERLMATFVPTAVELEKRTSATPTSVDEESRFVLERWPDGDLHYSLYCYRSKTQYMRAHADMIPAMLHDDPATEVGDD